VLRLRKITQLCYNSLPKEGALKRLIISLFIFSNFLSSQIISIDPDSLYQYLMPGDSATQQLTISNSGGDDLMFYFDTTITIANTFHSQPDTANYHTGTSDGISFTETSLIKTHGWDTPPSKEVGWAIFNISGMYYNIEVDSIIFNYYVNDTHDPWWLVVPVNVDPLTSSATTVYSDILSGASTGIPYLNRDEPVEFADSSWYSNMLINGANDDLENAIAQGFFIIGFTEESWDTTHYLNIDGWAEANPPSLDIYWSMTDGRQGVYRAPAIPENLIGNPNFENNRQVSLNTFSSRTFNRDNYPSWLNIDPIEDLVDGNSTLDVNIKFNAPENFPGGTLYTSLVLRSNDPIDSLLTIPTYLEIPDIYPPNFADSITATVEYGYINLNWDASLDASLHKYNIYKGSGSSGISNISTIALVDSVVGNPPILNYRDSVVTQEQVYHYQVSAVDQAGNESTLSDTASILYAFPAISVNSDSMYQYLLPGDSAAQTFTIANEGTDTLFYSIAADVGCGDYYIDNLPFFANGSNVGMGDDWPVNSGVTQGADVAYTFDVYETVTIDVSLCAVATNYDCRLEIFTNDDPECLNPVSTGYENDDGWIDCAIEQPDQQFEPSLLTDVTLVPGQYYIVVDGYDGDTGNYGITVTESASTGRSFSMGNSSIEYGLNKMQQHGIGDASIDLFQNQIKDVPAIQTPNERNAFTRDNNIMIEIDPDSGMVMPGDSVLINVSMSAPSDDPGGVYNSFIRIFSNDLIYSIMEIPITIEVRDIFPPNPVEDLTATPEYGYINLSWDAPLDSGIHKFNIYKGDSLSTIALTDSVVGNPPALNYRDSVVTQEQLYYYQVSAVDRAGNESTLSDVESAIYLAPILVINEFLASNDSCCTDESGEYDDYIEIHNFGTAAADIGGYIITDEIGNYDDYYQIPTGNDSTIIEPGGFLLLWADKDSEQGVLHVEIKLSIAGEQIGLFMQDSITVIDTLTFAEQFDDISYGRYPDGSGSWHFMHPSPDTTNTAYNVIPAAFSLSEPSNNTQITIDESNVNTGSITFTWGASSDANGDSLYYLMRAASAEIGDHGLDTNATSIELSYLDIIEDMSENNVTAATLGWTVLVTDGIDTVEADNAPFSITIDGANALSAYLEGLIPDEFALHQNYPNPFNPITTLRYDLPETDLVNITIYDMLGREVKTLINQTQDAGYRSVIWDATNDYGKPVSAGIY
ncbi:uncharacterized protein METZ01_LOCUS88020, partial [marine metagenome]